MFFSGRCSAAFRSRSQTSWRAWHAGHGAYVGDQVALSRAFRYGDDDAGNKVGGANDLKICKIEVDPCAKGTSHQSGATGCGRCEHSERAKPDSAAAAAAAAVMVRSVLGSLSACPSATRYPEGLTRAEQASVVVGPRWTWNSLHPASTDVVSEGDSWSAEERAAPGSMTCDVGTYLWCRGFPAAQRLRHSSLPWQGRILSLFRSFA